MYSLQNQMTKKQKTNWSKWDQFLRVTEIIYKLRNTFTRSETTQIGQIGQNLMTGSGLEVTVLAVLQDSLPLWPAGHFLSSNSVPFVQLVHLLQSWSSVAWTAPLSQPLGACFMDVTLYDTSQPLYPANLKPASCCFCSTRVVDPGCCSSWFIWTIWPH